MSELEIDEDTAINARHIALRGSLRLKYPTNGRCWLRCAHEEHRCFLADRHGEDCEFSSECSEAYHKIPLDFTTTP